MALMLAEEFGVRILVRPGTTREQLASSAVTLSGCGRGPSPLSFLPCLIFPAFMSAPFRTCVQTWPLSRVFLRMFFRANGSTSEADMLSEHIDGLYSYAMALSRNRVDAEDLVQETYVRAIPAFRRLRKESNVKSWMFTILRNIWLNQLRQPRVAVPMPGTDIDQFHAGILCAQCERSPLIVTDQPGSGPGSSGYHTASGRVPGDHSVARI